jgi:hypothetical protein
VQFVVTRQLASIMGFSHVKDAKDSLSAQSRRMQFMSAWLHVIVQWTKGVEIDANIADLKSVLRLA